MREDRGRGSDSSRQSRSTDSSADARRRVSERRDRTRFAERPERSSRSSRSESRQPSPQGVVGGAVGAVSGTMSGLASLFGSDERSQKVSIAFVLVLILAVFAVGKLFVLQVIDAQANLDRNGGQASQTYTIAAPRGTIYDTNGTILATTVDTINIFCHPHMVSADNYDAIATFLVENCGGKKEDYLKKLSVDKNFQYLYKNADKGLADKIKELGIDGFDYEKSNKRVYPCGAVGSQVIGTLTTGEDNQLTGVSGLERYYNDILSGTPGERVASYSREGVLIAGSASVTKEAQPGQDIVVSIDVEMQEELETALKVNAKSVQAETESGIVLDASTGEIVACAGSPTFDITDTSKVEEGATNMNGINFAYEPGSVFKPVIMLAALEAGTTKAGQSYECPATLKVGSFTIKDSHERGAETMSTTKIIADSSNIGMSLISQKLGAKKMSEYIKKYGLVGGTGVDYPAEAKGGMTSYKKWSKAQQYNISFGQGLTTSGLSIARFYGALANNGVACQPHFLVSVPSEGKNREYATEEIVKDKDALKSLIPMMEAVVTEGTATNAAIDGFTVAGKTGTAQTVNADGSYGHGVYNISFCGFLPGASKNLVCYVGATKVPGMYQTTTAFKDIMTFAIDRYNITQE